MSGINRWIAGVAASLVIAAVLAAFGLAARLERLESSLAVVAGAGGVVELSGRVARLEERVEALRAAGEEFRRPGQCFTTEDGVRLRAELRAEIADARAEARRLCEGCR